MFDGKVVLGVIPARGGSKRFPRKNIRPFLGRPLIAWTIKAAKESTFLDHLIVSTEDDEIASVAQGFGCEVLKRPPELSTDEATSEDVLRHALSNWPADLVVLLQPTSPQRTSFDIDTCIGLSSSGLPVVSCRADGTRNGAVYVATADWIQGNDFCVHFLGTKFTDYKMPDDRSLDIDFEHQLVNLEMVPEVMP